MCRKDNALNQELGRHRLYLRLLAGRYLNRRLWPRIDPSDVVHETFVQALEKKEQFRGQTEAQWLAWLRGILWHRLLTAISKE